MTVDVWMQHPTLRFMRHEMFESLRRWTGQKVPGEELSIDLTIAAMDAAGISFGLLSAWHAPDGPLIANDEVADWVTIGAYSGVHQFCRVGTHAFVGGYTVATKDVLPYSKTVGNRACIYGVNTIGLTRRGFATETIAAIRRAFRVLVQSRLNTSEAVARLEAEGSPHPEVRGLIEFIRGARRGVILKRHLRHRVSEEA